MKAETQVKGLVVALLIVLPRRRPGGGGHRHDQQRRPAVEFGLAPGDPQHRLSAECVPRGRSPSSTRACTTHGPLTHRRRGHAARRFAQSTAAGPTLASKSHAVSIAAYRALIDLFPTQQTTLFDPLIASLGHDPDDLTVDTRTPAGVGNVACAAVLAYRHSDGANQLGDLNGGAPYSDYTGYLPVNTARRADRSQSLAAAAHRDGIRTGVRRAALGTRRAVRARLAGSIPAGTAGAGGFVPVLASGHRSRRVERHAHGPAEGHRHVLGGWSEYRDAAGPLESAGAVGLAARPQHARPGREALLRAG